MKKTLTIMATLALGTTLSQAAVLSTLTFQRNGVEPEYCTVNVDSNYGLITPDRLRSFEGDPSYEFLDHTSISSDIIAPYSPMSGKNTRGRYWEIGFDVTNRSGQDILISSVGLSIIGIDKDPYSEDYIPANGLGGTYNYIPGPTPESPSGSFVGGFDEGNYNRPADITLTLEEGRSSVYTNTQAFNASTAPTTDVYGGSWAGSHSGTFDLGNSGFTLKAGESVALYVKISSYPLYDGEPIYIGLKNVVINGNFASVPEPATASLSLLGLVALMIRRRRA